MAQSLKVVGLKSVRATIFAFALLATLIPALGTAWISYRQNSRAIEDKLHEQLTGSARQTAREMDHWLRERLYEIRVFASSYEVSENLERAQGPNRARLTEYLTSVKDRVTDYRELLVVSPMQRVVASSNPEVGELHFDDRWMDQIRTTGTAHGEPFKPDPSAPVSMDIAVGITGVTGRFVGAFAGRLSFSDISEVLEGFVVDEDGTIIAGRAHGLMELPREILTALREADGAPTHYRTPDGFAVVGAAEPMPRTNWYAVAEIPRSVAFAEIAQLRNNTAMLVAVLLLVVSGLAYGLGLLIVRPLVRLQRAAVKVAGGDLNVHVPVAGGGELSYLTEVFNDMVRRLREGREELERLSVTDELTGLANRRRLMSELDRETQRSKRSERKFAVMMLDVDHFKNFNDTYGHAAGDLVLKYLAKVLRETVRDVDTVARYGGEEFTVVLPETKTPEAAMVAERIRARMAGAAVPVGNGKDVKVTVSIGLAEFPTHGDTAESIMGVADQALYQSKEAGRNRVTAAAGAGRITQV